MAKYRVMATVEGESPEALQKRLDENLYNFVFDDKEYASLAFGDVYRLLDNYGEPVTLYLVECNGNVDQEHDYQQILQVKHKQKRKLK